VVEAASNFDDLLYHIGAWTLIGLLVAAYLQAALGEGSLRAIGGTGLDILMVSVLAVPSYVCASSATPLAAVLLSKGISPGAVLCGLLLGPATNVATLAWLRKAFGLRPTLWGLGGLLVTAWGLALIANQVLTWKLPHPEIASAHEHGLLSYACGVGLLLLIVRAVWRNGLRTWLGALGETFALEPGAHRHAHEGVAPGLYAGLEHDSRLVAAVGVGTELHDRMERER
jgi:hypothetical protein